MLRIRKTTLRHSRNSVRGFSLIELGVTMSIAIVLAAIAVPLVQPAVANYRLRSTVGSVTGAIQSTRYRAISEGYPFKVVFSKANSTYQVSKDPEIDGSFTPHLGAVPLASSSPTLNQDTTFTFRPGGRVDSPQADANGITALTLTYGSRTGKIEVSAYGNIAVTYTQ